MKNILVTQDNLALISDALSEVNGGAWTHTYGGRDILQLAAMAEKLAMKLVIRNKKLLIGSKFIAWSGQNLPKNYGYGRLVNKVVLSRTRLGWTISSLTRETLGSHVPKPRLYLTRDAAAKAVKDFQETFGLVETNSDT